MFASVELAARIDRAEAALTMAIGRVAVERQMPDAFIEEIGGGVAVYAGPASPVNKMIGVGFEGTPADERLRSIEDLFRARKTRLQAEVSTLADPAFAATLTRRGYLLENFENVLGRALTQADRHPRLDARIEVRRSGRNESAKWLDAAMTGFFHPDEQGVAAAPLPPRAELEEACRPFTDVADFRRYCAWIDGELAGIASLRLDGALAQLCGAATLPAFRRRGVQTMLLRQRLADAFQHGCGLAVMMTQPGSKSQENGYRQGFLLLYSRAHLIKHPD